MFKAIFASSGGSSKPQKPTANDTSSSSSKSRTASPSSSPNMPFVPLLPSRGSSSAMAAWSVPPFPHPLPERRIGVLSSQQGLLVYPCSSSHLHRHPSSQHHTSQHAKASTSAAPSTPASHPYGSGDGFKVATIGTFNASYLSASAAPIGASSTLPPVTSLDVGFLIDWSKNAKITPLQPSAWKAILDAATEQDVSIECSGIIGISRFFSSSYLFVITSSKLIGHYFNQSRPIYCCTGVLAIPLLRDEASQAIRSQLVKQPKSAPLNDAPQGGALVDDAGSGENSSVSDSDSSDSDFDDVETPAAIPKEPFFSALPTSNRADTLRMPKSRPWLTRAARAVSDGRIEAISEDSAAQSQLSEALQPPSDVSELPQPGATPQSSEQIDHASEVNTTDAASANADELWHAAKQAELEDKAVRETAKYWARGEFWFSYDFDLTTSLQNKRKALIGSKSTDPQAVPRPGPLPTTHTRASQTPTADEGEIPALPLLAEPYPNLPLWRRADRRFWHNEHMSKDLIHAGLHAYILPIMQGYLQTVSLPIQPIDESERDQGISTSTGDSADAVVRCQMMVISRRSKERAGLRYQRRGINESGQVANFVETEQILYVLRRLGANLVGDVLSFVQIRGSIPLYWSQSPFSLKPPPVLERTEAENTQACRKHFGVQVERYGSITCVNLAEQGGKEGCISKAYRTAVENLRSEDPSTNKSGDDKVWDRKKLHYVDFDFHKECSGMKFENVAKLIAQMEPTLAEMRYYHHRTGGAGEVSGKHGPPINKAAEVGGTMDKVEVLSRQTGVFRVSCLDCLDRTNVVQSAFARHVLTGQLAKLGIKVDSAATTSIAAST